MNLLLWLLAGGLCGWLGGFAGRSSVQGGVLPSVVAGVLGGLLGGGAAELHSALTPQISGPSLLASLAGGAVLTAVYHGVRRARR